MRRIASVVIAVVGACATPSDRGTPGGRVANVDQLPQEHVEVLRAYGRGGADWESARQRVLASPSLTRFLVENLLVELGRAHTAIAGAEPARARRAFDRAGNELVRIGEPAVPTLCAMLAVGDGVTASLVGDVLARIGRPALPGVLAQLDAADADARRRAASVLALAPQAGARESAVRDALARVARADAQWFVRAEATRALAARGSRDVATRPWRLALEAGLHDADPAVAEAAARGLSELADPAAVAALIKSLERSASGGDLRGFAACQSALVALTGEREQPSVEGWRAWWREHGAAAERGEFVRPSR